MNGAKVRATTDGTPVHVAVRCARQGDPSPMRVDATGMDATGVVVEWWTCDRCGVTVGPWIRGQQLTLPTIDHDE